MEGLKRKGTVKVQTKQNQKHKGYKQQPDLEPGLRPKVKSVRYTIINIKSHW